MNLARLGTGFFLILLVGCVNSNYSTTPVGNEENGGAINPSGLPPAPPIPGPSDPLGSTTPLPTRSFLMGTAGFIPIHSPDSSAEEWKALFEGLSGYGELFGVYSAWNDNPKEGIPEQVRTGFGLKDPYGIIPLIALGVEPDSLSQADADTYFKKNGTAFKDTAVKVATEFKPAYLGLGVEINRFYEKSPIGFEDFVKTYVETYDAIKKVSPSTKVFPIFQYEYMKGGGKKSGKTHAPHFEIMSLFNGKMDAVGLTVYPFLDYDSVAQLPKGYLNELREHTGLPILITETGWPSKPVAGIGGSEDAQKAYLSWLEAEANVQGVEVITWIFPHDSVVPMGEGLFDSLSLKNNNGTPKSAWEDWLSLKALEHKE